jgi:hypothetical protein
MNTQWQPIDTVPQEIKDSAQDVWLARFVYPDYPIYGVGWWNHNNGFGYWKGNLIKPTHWMPIIPLTVD